VLGPMRWSWRLGRRHADSGLGLTWRIYSGPVAFLGPDAAVFTILQGKTSTILMTDHVHTTPPHLDGPP
jgi:hypothetical protein